VKLDDLFLHTQEHLIIHEAEHWAQLRLSGHADTLDIKVTSLDQVK